MTVDEVVKQLKELGSEAIKKVLQKHGAKEPFYGVKVEHLKKIQKKIKVDYQLAIDLYETGISDAMYLAGLIADDARMTKKDLQRWAEKAHWNMICEYTVPWVAAGSTHGNEMALKWIESKKEGVASVGWATLSNWVATQEDEALDIPELKKLLDRVAKTIHQQPNRVRYVMNGFVMAVGCYVKSLTDYAKATATKIGIVSVEMGGTSCKVPFALEYIDKVIQRGSVGKKRKTVKC